MSNNLFREKSLKRISSPEQLNDYIRVSNPSVWLLLIAVLLLLAGVCVWGITGSLDTVVSAAAIAENGDVTAYIPQDAASRVQAGMDVSIGENAGRVLEISDQPLRLGEDFSEAALRMGGLNAGEWVYAAALDVPCNDGVYTAEIVTERVSPISFVLN